MEITVLEKGATLNIKEKVPSLAKVRVGTGWDVSQNSGDFDLDLTAVLLNASGKVFDSNSLVYFGNLDYKANGKNAVHHTGDNLTGDGDGDDEQIEVTLADVPAEVTRIAFMVNIYKASERNQNFGMVNNSFVRLVNADSNEEFAKHSLKAEYSANTGVLVGELYREGDAWHFKATAEGVNGSIKEILQAKGME